MQTIIFINDASEVRSEIIGFNSEILGKEIKEKSVNDYVSIVELNLTTTPSVALKGVSPSVDFRIGSIYSIMEVSLINSKLKHFQKFRRRMKFEPNSHSLFMKTFLSVLPPYFYCPASHIRTSRNHFLLNLSKALDNSGTSDTSHMQTSHTSTDSDKLRYIAVQKKRKRCSLKNIFPLKTTKELQKCSFHSVIHNDKILSNKKLLFSIKCKILLEKCFRIKIYAISAKKYTITFIND